MSNSSIREVVEEIEYLRAKRAQASSASPRLVVVHGEHQPLTKCLPGETVEQVGLAVHSRVIPLSLSPIGLVVADVLARKRPMLLTAAQIERLLSSDPFCVRLGANASRALRPAVRLARKSVKVYIQRLRWQLGKALKAMGLAMLPEEILVSESTELSNVMTYRFAIPCEFVHLNGDAKRK
jgi:hypothetical protein